MSLSTIDQSTGNATVISGNVNDKVGNLSALTTIDKSSCVGAINEVKSGLIYVNDWALLSTFNTEYAVDVDYLELLFCETNESGGTHWVTSVMPARNIPSVIIVGTITLSRSGNTFTITDNPNSHYIKLFKR